MNNLHSVSGKTLRLQDRLRELSEPGQMVTYHELATLIGEDVQSGRGAGYLKTARNRIQSELPGFYLSVVRGVGIKRITQEEAVVVASSAVHSVRRKSSRALKTLANIDFDSLSGEGKVRHGVAVSCLGAVKLFTKPASQKRIEQGVRASSKGMEIGDTLKLFS
jgi:hypothetical protein